MILRANRARNASPLLLIGLAGLGAACGGGDTVEPRPAPPANQPPTSAVAIPDQTIIEGQTVSANIAGAFTDPDGDALSLAATSSNAAVASATMSGTELSVTGVAPGAAAITVTATDPGGLSASQSFAVEVDAATPTQLAVTPGTATLRAVGRTVQLSAEVLDQLGRPMSGASVAWSSGDRAVATVDANGLVTAAGNGEATITATAGDASGTAVITVRQSAHSVAVTPTFDTLTALGDTTRLVAVVRDEDGHVVPDRRGDLVHAPHAGRYGGLGRPGHGGGQRPRDDQRGGGRRSRHGPRLRRSDGQLGQTFRPRRTR